MAFLYQINPLTGSGKGIWLKWAPLKLCAKMVGEKDGDNDSDDSGGYDVVGIGAVLLYSPQHSRQGPFTEQSSAAF